jgi:hypothetical protein
MLVHGDHYVFFKHTASRKSFLVAEFAHFLQYVAANSSQVITYNFM